MARILAIDTTGEFASIALFAGDPSETWPQQQSPSQAHLLEEVLLHSPDGFGHVLFTEIDRLLKRHNISIASLDCLAAAAGPGSFTGVRVGLTAAKGLAEAARRPMVAVSNLKALAWHGTAPRRAVFLDARRGEIYGAVYTASLDLVGEELVMKFPAWAATLAGQDLEFITVDPAFFPTVNARQAPRALAGAVAAIANIEFLAGRAVDPAAVDANYVRRSDAELLWKDR